MTVGLPAAASVCEKPPSSNCTAAAPCSISVKWFKDNQHCTEPSAHHADISVGKNGMLIVTAHASVGNFTVLGFKRHPMPGGVCDWHKIQSYAKPFKVSPGGSAPAHDHISEGVLRGSFVPLSVDRNGLPKQIIERFPFLKDATALK